jgi:putative ABC transport system permease protein
MGLILLSIGIAFPLSWLAMINWLDQFAYRVPLTSWVFGFTGLTAIVITLLTISYQSIAAAMSNPVHSLRSE